GASKAVATTWHYLFTTAATAASAWDFRPGEALWTAMPLFHLSAAPAVLAPMLVGGTTVLAPTFHPASVWDEVRARGPGGEPLPDGAVGEIACRPRYPHVMSEGYVNASGLAVDPHPEWFRTGDLGVLDSDQNLTYVDRVKDSLRRRGENISSVEVETVVTAHPAVLEAAVIGVPSDLGEDDILLFVTVQPDRDLDYAELLDFCGARMPYFSVPRYVEIVSELPKTIIGRVRKDVLRTRGVGSAAWDRESHGYIVSR